MKQSAKRVYLQMNLPLLDPAASQEIPGDKQKELNRALMELLLHVAQEENLLPNNGGEHDE